jgi:hypothetical protein
MMMTVQTTELERDLLFARWDALIVKPGSSPVSFWPLWQALFRARQVALSKDESLFAYVYRNASQ